MVAITGHELATSSLLLRVTPDALRQMADKLELQARENSEFRESVTLQIADRITLVYHPPVRPRV